MLSEKFWNLINRTPIGSIVDKRINIMENTNPDRIYVENIRAFYNLPYPLAKTLCEVAVKEHVFRKKIAVFCPNSNCNRLIKSYNIGEEQDETLTCTQCLLREEEEHSFNTKDLQKEIYYQLVRK